MKNALQPSRQALHQNLFVIPFLAIFLFVLPNVYAISSPLTFQERSFEQVFEQSYLIFNYLASQQDSTIIQLKPFSFNPNTISAQDMNRMGLPQNISQTILRFRNKGGTFRRVEELGRIYGMTEEIFDKLRPFVKFD